MNAVAAERLGVLRQMLTARRRSTFWWSVGVALLVLSVLGAYPSVRSSSQGFESYLDSLPQGVVELLGAQGGLTSPDGYLNSQMYSNIFPVLLIVLGIGAASWAVAGSEGDGTLEMLLANPVPRARAAVERLLGTAVVTGVVALVATVVTAAMLPVVNLSGLPADGVWAAGLGAWALALCFSAVSFGVGAATGSKTAALGSGSAAAAGTYVLFGLTAFVSAVEPLRWVCPWFWFLDADPLAGADARFWMEAVALPLAVAGAFAAGGVARLVRRDLG